MATKGQVIADFVRGQLLEPVAGFFTDAELLAAINAGEADFFGWVHGKDAISDTSTQAGRQTYTLPGGIISIKKVFYNDLNADGSDNWKELEPTTLEKMSQEHPNFLSDSTLDRGTPARFMMHADELWFQPVPDTDGREVKVFHVSIPDPLETLNDYLDMDDSLVDGLKSYVLWQAWEKDKEPQRAAVEKANYQAYLGKGRRFYARRMGGLRRSIDLDSSRPYSRSSGQPFDNR